MDFWKRERGTNRKQQQQQQHYVDRRYTLPLPQHASNVWNMHNRVCACVRARLSGVSITSPMSAEQRVPIDCKRGSGQCRTNAKSLSDSRVTSSLTASASDDKIHDIQPTKMDNASVRDAHTHTHTNTHRYQFDQFR